MNAISPNDKPLPKYDISGLNVLILEQQSLMRDLMKHVFREFRVKNTHIADNVNVAFDIFCETDIDLILTDWSHGIDGMAFKKTSACTKIRQIHMCR
jgi:CheY-like chemotaxis protein